MIFIVDPITIATADLRTLPGTLGTELFLRAVRPHVRELLYTPEGAWDRYRTGQLAPAQLRLVRSALEAYLAQFPEFARVCVLSLAHDGGGSFTGKVLTARDDREELGILEAFWQIASKASRANYTIVSFDGTSFGGPFLLRRSRLLGLAPSLPIPLGRYRLEAHFDLAAVLSNWNRAHEFSLELWAARYGIPGPWETDTAQAIRDYLSAGATEEATAVARARLEAIHTLYQRLGPAYTA